MMTGRQAAHYSIIRQRIPERRHFGRKQTRMYQMDKGLLFPELKAEEKVEVEEAYFTGFQCYEEGYEKMNTCVYQMELEESGKWHTKLLMTV